MEKMPVLTVMKNGETVKTLPVNGDIVLGRADECQIQLKDRAISRHHALFRQVGKELQVEKKSEFAPVSVNGVECTHAILKEGDVLNLGPYLIRVSFSAEELASQQGHEEEQRKIEGEKGEEAHLQGAHEKVNGEAHGDAVLGLELGTPGAIEGGEREKEAGESGEEGRRIGNGAIENGGTPEGEINLAGQEFQLGQELNPDGNNSGNNPDGIQSASPSPESQEGPAGGEAQWAEPSVMPLVMIDENAKTQVGPTSKVAVKLIFKPGVTNVTEYEMKQDQVVIGRGKNCDIVVNDKKSSRRNALIQRAGLSFVIKDLDSVNGTYVNGEKIKEKELSGEDIIRVGGAEFQFKVVSLDYQAKEKNLVSVPDSPEGVQVPDLVMPAGGASQTADSPEIIPEVNILGAMADSNLASSQQDMASQQGMNGANSIPRTHQPAFGLSTGLAGADGAIFQQQSVGTQGSVGGIPGITGISGGSQKKKTLLERYRALPKRTQMVVTIGMIILLYWLSQDDPTSIPAKKPNTGKSPIPMAGKNLKGPGSFDSLTPDQKRFVEMQHDLAFNYYKNKDYDKAIFEIEKIFTLVSDYKDSREIERYAKEGKQKLNALEEERHAREEQEKIKAQIAELVEEAKQKMDAKHYDQAKDLFSQILALDPENASVAEWTKEIEAYEQQQLLKQQQRQAEMEVNQHSWKLLKAGLALKKKQKYHLAIHQFNQIKEIGTSNKKLLALAQKEIAECRSAIAHLRDPVLAEAKQAENSGEFAKAFALYKKATLIDPPHPDGYAGMDRVRGVLHDRAKEIYTEAILSESYSDFESAKKLYQKCLSVAPEDDLYHDRAERKLSHYFNNNQNNTDEAPSQ